MLRNLAGFAVVAAASLSTGTVRAEDIALPCRPQLADIGLAGTPRPGVTGASLCLQGKPSAILLDVRQTAIAQVLLALSAAYKISYRSSVPLSEIRDGKYEGSLGYVISRVLDGYNYAIKRESSNFEIIILSRRGDHAVSAPIITEVVQERAAPVSRTR